MTIAQGLQPTTQYHPNYGRELNFSTIPLPGPAVLSRYQTVPARCVDGGESRSDIRHGDAGDTRVERDHCHSFAPYPFLLGCDVFRTGTQIRGYDTRYTPDQLL